MNNLFMNELNKIKTTSLIKIVFGLFLLLAVFMAVMPPKGTRMFDYAYGAHIIFMNMCGTASIIFFSPVVVAMVTQEFSQRTVHNILACGVSRKKFYIVKTVCLMVTVLFIYLATIGVFTMVRSLIYGFNPLNYTYPGYGTVVFVYHACVITVIFTEVALFMCFAYLFNRPAAAYLACLGAVFAENFLFLRSDDKIRFAILTLFRMEDYLMDHIVLTTDFLILLIPVFIELILCLALSYVIFQKKDIS